MAEGKSDSDINEIKEVEEPSSTKPGSSISAAIDQITNFIEEKLKLSDRGVGTRSGFKDRKKVLEEPTLDAIVAFIASKKCKNIITMVGAGISTSAGIPDFRSPGSGLYANLKKYNLPRPEAIFALDYFHNDAKPFFSLAKELYPGTFKPTKTHYFIKLLQEKHLLLRHYTQNIDTLERIAGISSEKLVEAHGTFHTGHCLGCNKEYSQEWMKEEIFRDEIPICTDCPGVVKPDIVFFGENLPPKFYKCMPKDFKQCDLLIIMGSSLLVQPFAQLVDRVKCNTPRMLINMVKAGETMEFDYEDNVRDVLMLGDCDEQVQILADKLGWGDDLKALVEKEHAKIDSDNAKTAQSKDRDKTSSL